jgi:toxin CcdB
MPQFDVYANPNPESARLYPYLLEIQSDLLADMPTTVVIPLGVPEMIEQSPIVRLNPRVEVENRELFAMTQELASIPRRPLKHPVAHLSAQREGFLGAIDLLFTGF